MLCRTLFLLLCAVWGLTPLAAQPPPPPEPFQPPPPQPAAEPADPTLLRIGVLHVDTLTGQRYRSGIEAAVEGTSGVELHLEAYANQQQGVERLEEMLTEQSVDVVVGPTESGIFVQAEQRRGELEAHRIPIISPLVTADVPHQVGGWFFRTNVDLRRRSHAIYDFLNKYWVRSIALLYANTEFGRRAEDAFRRELDPDQQSSYLPQLFNSPPTAARGQLRQILETRPEAVGIVGEREDIADLYASLERMNDRGTAYRPILFTILDTRFTTGLPENFYYVSVTRTTDDGYDDINALAFDTTRLVVEIWQQLPPELAGAARREAFRDRFEATMRGYKMENSKTGLVFGGHENITTPRVFHFLDDGQVEPVDLLQPVGILGKLVKKCELILGRYGPWPAINLLMIAVIVVLTTVADVRNWYSGKKEHHLFNPLDRQNHPFLALVAVNLATAWGLYIYMAESGNINYGSPIAALALAVAPLALIRARLFETRSGQSVGLGKYYEALLKWINKRLMLQSFTENKIPVNLLAYNNSVDGMKSYLLDIYRESYSVEQRVRLETELEEEIVQRPTYIEKRKYCAKLLMRTVNDWNQLYKDNLAPCSLEERTQQVDPEAVIRDIAQRAAKSSVAREEIDCEIERALDDLEEKRRNDLAATLARDIEEIVGETGIQRRKLAFLCVLRGYDKARLEKLCPATTTGQNPDDPRSIHLIAYNNSVPGMKSYLNDFFSGFRTSHQRAQMELALNEELGHAASNFERRKVCARFLARSVPWDRLEGDNMAPLSPDPSRQLRDPEVVIRRLAQHFAGHPPQESIRDQVEGELTELDGTDKTRADDLREELAKDLKGIVGRQSVLRRQLTFLCTLRGFRTFLETAWPDELDKEEWYEPPEPPEPEPVAETSEDRWDL